MAINANTVWEFRQTGTAATNGGGFGWLSLVNSTYRWIESVTKPGEYHVELSGGGDPSLAGQTGMSVTTDGTFNEDTEGTVGSLTAGQWDWADNDSLGYSTVYVRLDDDTDPDTKSDGFVQMGLFGGQDYSQQASPQLGTLTDGATSGIGVTTFTSVTGGFTALMVGNVLQIASGTNVNIGWYQITAHTDTNTVTLDQAPDDGVGGVSGANFRVGGALDILTDNLFDNVNAPGYVTGNLAYIKSDGSMTLGAGITTSLDGTATDPNEIEGYDSSRGDNPVGANRPTIIAAGNAWDFDNTWHLKNLIFTTTSSLGIAVDVACQINNCKVTNSSGSGGRAGFHTSSSVHFIVCEAISTNGNAISSGADNNYIACYIHDSTTGILMASSGDRQRVINCIIDTCTTGLSIANSAVGHTIVNNTFYNNTTAMDIGTVSSNSVIINNIFDANTTGLDYADLDRTGVIDYNVWNNTTDVVNIPKGDHSITGDPGLTDPANGDFTLGDGSNAIDAGLDATNAGATV